MAIAIERTPVTLCALLAFTDLVAASSGASFTAAPEAAGFKLFLLNFSHVQQRILFIFDCQLFDVGMNILWNVFVYPCMIACFFFNLVTWLQYG